MVKDDGEDKFNRMPLVVTGDAATFEGMLFDVKASMSYYVEADGVRSPTYSMKVVELPAVAALEIEYVFPAYTGLPPQKVEAGGDVAALAGTEVRIRATSTMATPAGRIQLDPGKPSAIAAQPDGDADRQLQDRRRTATTTSSSTARAARRSRRRRSTRSTRSRISRRRCRSRSRSATRPRIRSKKCSCRRARRTTSACASSISSTRSTADPRRRWRCTARAPSRWRKSAPATPSTWKSWA